MKATKRNGRPNPRRRRRRGLLDADATDDDAPSCPSSSSLPDLNPSSLGYYDALYDSARSSNFAASSRVGSVEVISTTTTTTTADGDAIFSGGVTSGGDGVATNRTAAYAIMRLVTINALSAPRIDPVAGTRTLVPRGNGGTQIYGDLAGILLGAHHFNNGVGSVVREIEDIHSRCPIRIAVDDFFDSESSQTVAVTKFGNEVIAPEHPDRPPSVLVGAWRSAVSVPLAILGGAYEIPQISPLSTSTELDDREVYGYFGRLIPSDAGTARGVVDYLTKPGLGVRHLGMIYVNDPYGSTFHQAIVEASLARPEGERVTVKGHPFSYSADSYSEIETQVRQLALTGYRYFFGVFYDEHYETIMELAYKHGIAGPGCVWIVSDGLSETFLGGRTYEAGSPLAIASRGVGILKAEGGRETEDGEGGYDRFARAWYEQGADDVDYYNCKRPKDNSIGDPSIYFEGPSDFFAGRRLAPTAGAVFAYDSVVALGMAACELHEERGDAYFDGGELFDKFVTRSFEGASGEVRVDPGTASRDPESAFFVLYNARGESDGKQMTFSVRTVAHSAPNPDPDSTGVHWVGYDNEAYVYSDGTANPPNSLPPAEAETNHLPTGVRAAGLAVLAIIFTMALFFGLWTKRNRGERVVKASQPEFLYMLCVGAVVLGSTLVPLSMDDSVLDGSGCDKACMSIPWLFCCGFAIVFSALFAKTWRLNKIMANAARSMKMKVTVQDAMRPFVLLLILNTVVLTTWTKLDPLKWTRIETGLVDGFGRSLDSYGICTSPNIVPYVATLFVINFSFVLLANYQVYRARNLSTEFSESKYVSIIFASLFQSIVVGLPLSVIVARDPVARFIVHTCIIGAMCLSTLCFMFVPKVWATKNREEEEEEDPNFDETAVERTQLTEVRANVAEGEENNEEEGGNFIGSIWGGAQEIYRRARYVPSESGDDSANRPEEGDGVIRSRSLFVGTLIRRSSSMGSTGD